MGGVRPIDFRMQGALSELESLIQVRFPGARFRVSRGVDDANVVHLIAMVDVDDLDAVLDTVVDRMMELQIDEGLPIFVVPVRPPKPVAEAPDRHHVAQREHGRALLEEPSKAPS